MTLLDTAEHDPLFLILSFIVSLPRIVLLAVLFGVICWVASLVLLIRAPVAKRQHWTAKASHVIAGILTVPVLLWSGWVFLAAGFGEGMTGYQLLPSISPGGCRVVVETDEGGMMANWPSNYVYLAVPGSVVLRPIGSLLPSLSANDIKTGELTLSWNGNSGVLRVGSYNVYINGIPMQDTTIYCPV